MVAIFSTVEINPRMRCVNASSLPCIRRLRIYLTIYVSIFVSILAYTCPKWDPMISTNGMSTWKKATRSDGPNAKKPDPMSECWNFICRTKTSVRKTVAPSFQWFVFEMGVSRNVRASIFSHPNVKQAQQDKVTTSNVPLSRAVPFSPYVLSHQVLTALNRTRALRRLLLGVILSIV